MPAQRKQSFRSQNLMATVLTPNNTMCFGIGLVPPVTTTCPIVTFCLPKSSRGIFDCGVSGVVPRKELSAKDLNSLMKDLKTKLKAQKRGVDLVLRPKTARQYDAFTKTLTHNKLEPLMRKPMKRK